MTDISNLQSERRKYYSLKEKMMEVRDILKSSLDYLEDADKKVVVGYNIDDLRGDDGFLQTRKTEIQNLYNTLNNNVIPSINSNIYKLGNEIENALSAEEI